MRMFYLILILSACNTQDAHQKIQNDQPQPQLELPADTVKDRFEVPSGYKRTHVTDGSFAHYLRHLKLKPRGSKVRYYNGQEKNSEGIYCGVIDLDIGSQDLHQCADAVMRLKAEYHFHNEDYEKIHFNFTNGHRVEYKQWMEGNRMIVNGNKTHWEKKAQPSKSYEEFWNYLELIFMYAGTASLSNEMVSIDKEEADIGDVLIIGGFPGHAVIIVDKAVGTQTRESLFLLAQSYMPAQEIQILVNNNDQNISPWYRFDGETISTPEWTFESTALKRFVD